MSEGPTIASTHADEEEQKGDTEHEVPTRTANESGKGSLSGLIRACLPPCKPDHDPASLGLSLAVKYEDVVIQQHDGYEARQNDRSDLQRLEKISIPFGPGTHMSLRRTAQKKPSVYSSVGGRFSDFEFRLSMALEERTSWLISSQSPEGDEIRYRHLFSKAFSTANTISRTISAYNCLPNPADGAQSGCCLPIPLRARRESDDQEEIGNYIEE